MVFRKVFEEIVRRCLEAGFVEGRNVAVDGTLVGANASQQSRVPREKLVEAAQHSRTVQEYLTAIHHARALLAEQIGRFTLEQVSENGVVSFKANGQIDFFGEEALHAWVVPGARLAPCSPLIPFDIRMAA